MTRGSPSAASWASNASRAAGCAGSMARAARSEATASPAAPSRVLCNSARESHRSRRSRGSAVCSMRAPTEASTCTHRPAVSCSRCSAWRAAASEGVRFSTPWSSASARSGSIVARASAARTRSASAADRVGRLFRPRPRRARASLLPSPRARRRPREPQDRDAPMGLDPKHGLVAGRGARGVAERLFLEKRNRLQVRDPSLRVPSRARRRARAPRSGARLGNRGSRWRGRKQPEQEVDGLVVGRVSHEGRAHVLGRARGVAQRFGESRSADEQPGALACRFGGRGSASPQRDAPVGGRRCLQQPVELFGDRRVRRAEAERALDRDDRSVAIPESTPRGWRWHEADGDESEAQRCPRAVLDGRARRRAADQPPRGGR